MNVRKLKQKAGIIWRSTQNAIIIIRGEHFVAILKFWETCRNINVLEY